MIISSGARRIQLFSSKTWMPITDPRRFGGELLGRPGTSRRTAQAREARRSLFPPAPSWDPASFMWRRPYGARLRDAEAGIHKCELRSPRPRTTKAPERLFLARSRARLQFNHRREAAENHPAAVKGHGVLLLVHAGIGCFRLLHPAGHGFHGCIARRLVGPFDPGEDDSLVLLRLHRFAEIRELALRHIIAPALDDTQSAELDEDAVAELCMLDEFLPVRHWHRNQETVNIAHCLSPSAAASRVAISIFRIVIIASKARFALSRSGLVVRSSSRRGVICQECPQRSLLQPQALSTPPSARLAFQ